MDLSECKLRPLQQYCIRNFSMIVLEYNVCYVVQYRCPGSVSRVVLKRHRIWTLIVMENIYQPRKGGLLPILVLRSRLLLYKSVCLNYTCRKCLYRTAFTTYDCFRLRAQAPQHSHDLACHLSAELNTRRVSCQSLPPESLLYKTSSTRRGIY